MKYVFVFLFLFAELLNMNAKVFSTDTITVNGTKFLFVKCLSENEDSGNMDTVWKVYRIENGTRHYLLKQEIYAKDGDCNSIFENFGTYEVKGDSIIFKTEFSVERDKNFGLPYREKQIYIVKDDGKLILIYDGEEYDDGWRKKNN